MQVHDFTAGASGRCLKADRNYYTFIPNPLPPTISPDWSLAKLLSEADQALSELSAISRYLPHPQILMPSYIRREAVLSSRIENTQADMNDLFAYEVGETHTRTADVKEVANYVKALLYGIERLKELPICSRLLRELHKILMDGVRGGQVFPGEFRTTQNWIGPPGCTLAEATYVPPPPDEMELALSDLEKYINAETREPLLVKCAFIHYQFEAIHPFVDGNGRIGRLLITLFLCSNGLLSEPLLYLSEFIEKYRENYYRLLLSVSQKGSWREWVEFFLRGVRVQSANASEQAKGLIALNQSYRTKLGTKRIPEAAWRLIDHIFSNPMIAPAKLAAEWEISFSTMMKGVDRLVSLGILEEMTNKQRNRIYRAVEVATMLTKGA